jgi:hypothetical protein
MTNITVFFRLKGTVCELMFDCAVDKMGGHLHLLIVVLKDKRVNHD